MRDWQKHDRLPTREEAIEYLESEGLDVEKIKEDGRKFINKIRIMVTDRDALPLINPEE